MDQARVIEMPLSEWLVRAANVDSHNSIDQGYAAIASTIGLARQENQDRAALVRCVTKSDRSAPTLIAIVCDGLGGMRQGAQCAALAIAAFVESLIANVNRSNVEAISAACNHANERVFAFLGGRGGTTLSTVVRSPAGRAWVANIGDSRVFLANQGHVQQLTKDDTIGEQVKQVYGADHASNDPLMSRLAQFVGMGPGLQPHVSEISPWRADSRIVITTDGAHNVPSELLYELIRNADQSLSAVRRLVQLSLWLGGKDNATALAFDNSQAASLARANRVNSNSVIEVWDYAAKLELMYIAEQTLSSADKEEQAPKRPAKPRRQKASAKQKSQRAQPRASDQPALNIQIFEETKPNGDT